MKPTGTIKLKPGKEKPFLNHHPWVFSGAVASKRGDPADGDIVDVLDERGRFLARGYYNRQSQIVVRLLTWDPATEVDAALFCRRIQQAAARRADILAAHDTNACRLVHAESDLLPGLIVDRYADYLVTQFLTAGMERWKPDIVRCLAGLPGVRGIYDRSDVDVREKEGLAPTAGTLYGEMPPDIVEIREHSYRFVVDVKGGQKTGFYLDQRVNRGRVAAYCRGREVLNAFAYTGAFAVYALAAGATRVVNIDTSADALSRASYHLALNGLTERMVENVVGDAFAVLRQYRDAGRQFDLIILDPPKFAYARSQVEAACRGYKDINLLAMQLLRPDGILCSFSCSGLISADLFQKVLFGASVDAGRDMQIVEKLSQSPDHPISLAFPEGEYLKGLICRAL